MKPQIIGLSGFARVGKDSLYLMASEILKQEYMLSAKRYALADILKADIRDFILEKVGIDVYTTNDAEKTAIRPLLVAYGKCKRIQSKATYWTSLLQRKIESDTKSDVVFITDIRYAEYEEDEVQWIKKIGGELVHISKFTTDPNTGNSVYVEAPNEDEANNDPVIRSHADILFEWEHCLDSSGRLDIEYMKSKVRPLLSKMIR